MSNVNADKAFDRAVDLVVHADKVTNMWVGRLVAVQTSLVIAEGALLVWKGNQSDPIVASFVALIGIVAIVLLFALARIVIREHDTGYGYIKMVKRTEGTNPLLFRDEDSGPPGPKFSTVIETVKWVLAIAWFIFLLVTVGSIYCR
ncbi:MAG TPA: hypothetical protein VEM15_12145 [Thermodesulfobacteriota bacterium]|nr:hypothetical protein [Thermodesulfobacteriota bacterium]